MSATTLHVSGFLSAEENRAADRHTFETLTKKHDRIVGMIRGFEGQKSTADSSRLKVLVTSIKKLEPQLVELQEQIAKISTRVIRVSGPMGLPQLPARYDALNTCKGVIAQAQQVALKLAATPKPDATAGNILLQQLPREMLAQLQVDVQAQKGTDGTAALLAEPELAVTLLNGDGISLLQVRINDLMTAQQGLKDELAPAFMARAREFTQKVQSYQFTHDVLKNIYDSLEPETQALIAHKPPYYGIGLNAHLYEQRGAQVQTDGSVRFSVFAPDAASVSLQLTSVGPDADDELERPLAVPMEKDAATGVWQTTVEELGEGSRYYYEVTTKSGHKRKKVDPMGFGFSRRESDKVLPYENVVRDRNSYQWGDQVWIGKRTAKQPQPMNIYELHPTLWKKECSKNWRDLAPQIIEHCKEFNFTHIELMATLDHPNEASWGYQAFGFFAPNHRLGSMDDLKFFVDQLHQAGIGIIVDWVPAHFCIDSHSLEQFDGTPLYEKRDLIHNDDRYHPDRLETPQVNRSVVSKSHALSPSLHPDWKSYEFDFGKDAARDLLYSSADFWLNHMHFDGLRVDAVSSMIYLDFGRQGKQILPSQRGDNINHDALEFMRNLNGYAERTAPGALMIAEESSGFGRLVEPTEKGGIGFHSSWNMGWMNNTLHGISRSDFGKIKHGRTIARGQPTVLPLSHDEIAQGKKSLLGKMTGSYEQQLAKTRNLIAYQTCLPGAKLKMMSMEFAQREEWTYALREPADRRHGVRWDQMEEEGHTDFAEMTKALGKLYKEDDAFWYHDGEVTAMFDSGVDDTNKVMSYHRKGSLDNRQVLCIHNFSDKTHKSYQIKLPNTAPYNNTDSIRLRVLFNTDAEAWYGDSSTEITLRIQKTPSGDPYIQLSRLPGNSTVIIEEVFG